MPACSHYLNRKSLRVVMVSMDQHRVTRRKRAVILAAVLGAALSIFVLVWFQPQKILIEKTVDEAFPRIPPNTSLGPGRTSQTLAAGEFRDLEHPTSGAAQLLRLADERHFLRLERLDTSNGPDLRVYLSEIPASDDWYAYGERFIDLGALKGNRGNQNYEIPAGIDVDRYESAVIWCRRFSVGFGVAPLTN